MPIENQCQFIGNLTRDAEMRYAPSGDAVTSFNIGVNKQYTSKDGNKVKKTTWVKCTIWGKLAEALTEYLTKGKMVVVEGELMSDDSGNPRLWEDKEGNKRASHEIRVHEIKLCGGPRGEAVEEDPKADEPVAVESEDSIPF